MNNVEISYKMVLKLETYMEKEIESTSLINVRLSPHSTHHLSHLIMKCILLNFPLHRISLRKCQDNGVRKQSRPAVPALPSASGAGASP